MGGRGSSGGRLSLKEVVALTKQLPRLKAVESRAEREWNLASGAVRMTPHGRNDLLKQRRTARDKARDKYLQAKEKREKAEEKLEKYARRNRRRITPF